jgi:threonine dehydratase
VNTENIPHYYESFKQGKPVNVYRKPTIADGISSGFTSDHMLKLLQNNVDQMVLVSEEEIKESIRLLALENKMVVEGAGAASLAAALNQTREERGKSVCILSGGTIEASILAEILDTS